MQVYLPHWVISSLPGQDKFSFTMVSTSALPITKHMVLYLVDPKIKCNDNYYKLKIGKETSKMLAVICKYCMRKMLDSTRKPQSSQIQGKVYNKQPCAM